MAINSNVSRFWIWNNDSNDACRGITKIVEL